jgi:hypothetical protein
MKIRLKDIIDLEYLTSIDDALESKQDVKARAIKDRKIYHQCQKKYQNGQYLDDKTLLFSWLAQRREEFCQSSGENSHNLLPGSVFSLFYTWLIYAMFFFGGATGISLAYSFLAYHGNRPINVAVFIALFVVLQLILIIFTLLFIVKRFIGTKRSSHNFSKPIIHTLISSLFLYVLPKISKKTDWTVFKKIFNTLEYKSLFFWPFFILTSIFAFCFCTGALGGTFFRVLTSDLAFGWQSTLMATNQKIYALVSYMSLPWSFFVPPEFVHPSLEQIQGSRIFLKDGISVLATQDLISWWPFICMAVLCYAVIPRGLIMVSGILVQNYTLSRISFQRPGARQVIIRMTSPVLDIDERQEPASLAVQENPIKDMSKDIIKTPTPSPQSDIRQENTIILSSKTVYTDAIITKVIQHIEEYLFLKVNKTMRINPDFDANIINEQTFTGVDQAIFLHEVWQPPIRGILHYIIQIKSAMPRGKALIVLLTGDAGQKDLSVPVDDMDFDIWKKAILKLDDSKIIVKRYI